MLLQIFNKDRPAIFLTLVVWMTFFYVYYTTTAGTYRLVWHDVAFGVFVWTFFVVSVWLIDFIGKKNALSKSNSYKSAVYAFSVAALPFFVMDPFALCASFFVLLAMRRILSLRSGKEVSKKVFDASLWIALASCFYFWAIVFFLVLYVAILIYAANRYKNWIIPFVGVATVMVFANTYTLLLQNAFYTPLDWAKPVSFDFSAYSNIRIVLPATIFLVFSFWATLHLLLRLGKKSIKARQTIYIIITSMVAGMALLVLATKNNGSELGFFAIPFSFIMAEYLQVKKEKPFKEGLLWALVLLPFIVLFI